MTQTESTETKPAIDVEAACEVMHDAYEKAAIGAGWETNPASRKPWSDVPEPNKVTMRAAVAALLDHLRPEPRVWRAGDPEPKQDVRAVLDMEGDVWQRRQGGWPWVLHDEVPVTWNELLHTYGTMVEVALPGPVFE